MVKHADVEEAKTRSLRTLFQGAVVAVIIAVLDVLAGFITGTLTPENVFVLETYSNLVPVVRVAAAMALVSYLQKLVGK